MNRKIFKSNESFRFYFWYRKSIEGVLNSLHSFIQIQQWEHENNVGGLFNVNIKDTKTKSIM